MPELNAAQKQAVYSDAPKILCLAGAGTGKTFSLVQRIIRLGQEVDPESILALTFTNNAAFEMRTRYRKAVDNPRQPEFRTFHGFCYNLITNDSAILHELGYKRVPKIYDKNQQKKLENDIKLQMNIRLSEKKLQGGVPLTPKEQYERDTYFKRVDNTIRKEGSITFATLLQKICDLFINDDPCVDQYKQQYKYIFVDEFQDTDPLQWEFVRSFPDAHIFCVGDALQSIYGFRGATSKYIKELSTDPEWEVIRLTENYRSVIPIINVANDMSDHADESYRLDLTSTRPGPAVHFMTWLPSRPFDRKSIDEKSTSEMMKIICNSTGTTAILARTNAEVGNICDFLKRNGMDATSSKLDTDPENFVKALTDREFMLDWLSSLLNFEQAAQYMRLVKLEPDKDPLDIIIACANNSESVMYRIRTLNEMRRTIVQPGVDKREKARKICDLIGCPNLSIVYPDPQGRRLGEILLEAIENQNKSSIYVGTVHSSKGLEYDNVFLIGPGGKSFPLSTEEDLNLRYVGVTRARTNLYIYEGVPDPYDKNASHRGNRFIA